MYSYMEDCLHLKACRRLCKKVKNENFGVSVLRGCNEECSAYQPCKNEDDRTTSERLYTREEVRAVMHGACRDGLNGIDPYDCLIEDYIYD